MSKAQFQLPPISNRKPSFTGSQSVKNLHQHHQTYDSNMDDSNRSEKNFKDHKSPFTLPSDDEVFLYCQQERQKKEEGKRGMQDQHIWEKKTATSKNALKHYKSFQGQINEKHLTQTAYRADEKKLIQTALNICKKRKNINESGPKRESIVDLLEQKKEMFLVTMSHGIIESEIQRLQKISLDREQALMQSKKLLKQDEQNFTEYLEKNKQDRLTAEVSADGETKDRKGRENQLKELNIKLTSIRTEKSRNEELVANYTENKYFIDKLAPKEWQQEKDLKRKELLEDNLFQWVQEQVNKIIEEEEQNRQQNRGRTKMTRNNEQINSLKNLKSKEYWDRASQGNLDFLQEFEDNYPIHFTDPNQLVVHFDTMEQKNLNSLSENQELEEQYEELQSGFQKIEQEMNKRTNDLQKQKDFFKKQIDELDVQIKAMKKKSEENRNMINKEGQELTFKIEQLYKIFQNDLPIISDFKNQNIITILSNIEIYMEKQLKNLQKYKPSMVEHFMGKAQKARIFQIRKQVSEKLQEEMAEKNKKNLEKLMSVTYKREGRKIMTKSKPQVKEQKVEDIKADNSDEEDKKYFMEGYNLL